MGQESRQRTRDLRDLPLSSHTSAAALCSSPLTAFYFLLPSAFPSLFLALEKPKIELRPNLSRKVALGASGLSPGCGGA